MKARGICNAHYAKMNKYGNPIVVKRPPKSNICVACNISPRKSDTIARCESCIVEYRKKWWSANKGYQLGRSRKARSVISSIIDNIKSNPCTDCRNRFHPCAMDFDHVTGEKLFNIANGIYLKKSDEEIIEEIKKCELVCSNCHRIRTYNRRKHPKY